MTADTEKMSPAGIKNAEEEYLNRKKKGEEK